MPPSDRKPPLKAVTSPTRALVPLPRPVDDVEPLPDPRLSDVDEWGRSERVRELVRTLYDPIYRHWFRVEWEGLEKIPANGGALIVANHAGAIPSDAPAIMHGIESELGRAVYGLAEFIFRDLPLIGTGWARNGGVTAQPDNAYRLLREQQQLVLVFPEGTKGTGKVYNERYRLRRFGRGGFVEIAMRAGVPIIPIAVVGAEESMPILFKMPAVAKAIGVPYFPVTANMLLLPGRVARHDRLLPGQVQAARARPDLVRRRRARPGPLLALEGDGRVGEHPRAHPRGAVRDAPRAALGLVRLMGRRVLVTGLSTFWGGRVAQALEADPTVEVIVGLDRDEPTVELERTEYVRSDESYSILSRIVKATKVDTIVHTFLIVDSTSASASAMHEINVIGTMNLFAAASQAGSTVRNVVVKSSTLVYGSGPRPGAGSARRRSAPRRCARRSSGRSPPSSSTCATSPTTTPT